MCPLNYQFANFQLAVDFPKGNMVKKDKFDSTIESLREEITAIATRFSDMKNDEVLTLREKNITPKNRINSLEPLFESSDIVWNKLDQYSRRNNVVVGVIPSSMKNRELEGKCVDVLGKKHVKINEYDIEVCHGLGKSFKTIIRFVSRNFCSKILKTILTKWPTKRKPDRNWFAWKSDFVLYISLYDKERIYSTWCYSGSVFIKKCRKSKKSIEIHYLN